MKQPKTDQKNAVNEEEKKEEPDQKLQKFLTDFLAGNDCFIGRNTGKAYIVWEDANNVWHNDMVESQLFRATLRELLEVNVDNKIYSEYELNKIISHIRDKILMLGVKKEVCGRMAYYHGVIYYNLNDTAQKVVVIKPDSWEIVDFGQIVNKDFAFVATPSMDCQLVDKKKNGQGTLMDLLKPYMNLSEDEQKLLVITIITWFIDDIPKPVIILHGGQGSGKTTLTNMLQKIVDPRNHGAFVMPNNKEELSIALANNYLLTLDNASSLPRDASDLLCSAVTGASTIKRKLFTDNDISVVSFKNCILLNGIIINKIKSDFYDRTIMLRMRRLKGMYKSNDAIYKGFKRILPCIMGEIFFTLSKALTVYQDIDSCGDYRMADYVKWGRAISKVLFGDDKVFLDSYDKNRLEVTSYIIEDHPLSTVLKEYLNGLSQFPVEITPANLLKELTAKAEKGTNQIRSCDKTADSAPDLSYALRDRRWPKSPQSLSKGLIKLKENFAEEGYVIDVGNIKRNGVRYIVFNKSE